MTFSLVPLYYNEMNEAVAAETVDFILTNPAHFIAIRQENNLSGAMVTLMEKKDGEAQFEFGCVIFARNEPSAPKTLADVKGKTISAVGPDSLGGYQAAAFELSKVGIDLEKDTHVVFTGMPHNLAVYRVLQGQSDIGFVRTGVLENMIANGALDPDQIIILNPVITGRFTNYLSTELYPEWPFAALPHIDHSTARTVAAMLLKLDPQGEEAMAIGIYGFNIPSSYLVVEEMMRELKLPPFDQSYQVTIVDIWNTYNSMILMIIGIFSFFVVVGVVKIKTGEEIKRKNIELNKVMDKLEEANKSLENLSLKDSLTQLYNRRYFDIAFEEKMNLSKRSNVPLAVCIIDIDLFKDINGKYGHLMGDKILCEVAARIAQQALRTTDFTARFGGDEFIVVLYDITEEGALVVAKRIQKAVRKIDVLSDYIKEDVKITLSIGGVVTVPQEQRTVEAVFQCADTAMYEAKKSGGDRINLIKI